ncbi:GNAT family N-acetyltransferase [Shouchella lonarensis]|uniref:Ribosomal protein S18 acetylase RimI n=1 Tax=Shouchella lonarensis TaxID=1464122 RepID=A0A1G6NIM4_9BACI|nr:N-acetyltransferase [Shouchella lonarensis]SDC67177.1 Ribosomal protein S18 acetylase RimI [Shouchella lonarensis]
MNQQVEQVNFKELASFLASMNQLPQHHVGYCGSKAAEILSTLEEDFSPTDFVVQYGQGEIIGALGFEVDMERKEIELWGPFVQAPNWEEIADQLWHQRVSLLSGTETYTCWSFYNEQNSTAITWMKQKQATFTGRACILQVTSNSCKRYGIGVEQLQRDNEAAFIALHDELFPNTYYSGREIVERLNEEQVVYVVKEAKEMVGYVYVEGQKAFKEGSIEFIGVKENARKKGYGKRLLSQAVHFLFEAIGVEDITLCVDTDQQAAINLYKSIGFTEKHTLEAYKLAVTARKER